MPSNVPKTASSAGERVMVPPMEILYFLVPFIISLMVTSIIIYFSQRDN